MAQAVTGFNRGSVHAGFVAGVLALGQVFLPSV